MFPALSRCVLTILEGDQASHDPKPPLTKPQGDALACAHHRNISLTSPDNNMPESSHTASNNQTQIRQSPSDYDAIREENRHRYGTDIDRIGPMLLANRYADRTQFIYELLQNAEDALNRRTDSHNRRMVSFDLDADRLRVSHYGVPFNEKDVRGVCGIDESTKKLNEIGRFGIGFKSVFAFTERPEIHSGAESFAVESYVWPVATEPERRERDETVFVIPFRDRGDAGLRAVHPDHVWALDFQFDVTASGREFKILHVIDEFTRESLADVVDYSIDADAAVTCLDKAASARGRSPDNIRCDNGPELTAYALRDWCALTGAKTSYIEPGSPWQNPWVESYGSRMRDELLSIEQFDSLLEAQVLVNDWRNDYNTHRPHSALGMLTPTEHADQRANNNQPKLSQQTNQKRGSGHAGGRLGCWLRRRLPANACERLLPGMNRVAVVGRVSGSGCK